MIITGSNFIGLFLALIANMAVGALWYSTLMFGKKWMKLRNIKQGDITPAEQRKSMILALINAVIIVFVFTLLMRLTFVDSIGSGIKLALLVWLGFTATTGVYEVIFGGKPFKLFLIDTGNQLVSYVVMAIIMAAFNNWPK